MSKRATNYHSLFKKCLDGKKSCKSEIDTIPDEQILQWIQSDLIGYDLPIKSYGNPSHGSTKGCDGKDLFNYFSTNYYLSTNNRVGQMLCWIPFKPYSRIALDFIGFQHEGSECHSLPRIQIAFRCFNPLRPAPRSCEEKEPYTTYFLSLKYGDKLV